MKWLLWSFQAGQDRDRIGAITTAKVSSRKIEADNRGMRIRQLADHEKSAAVTRADLKDGLGTMLLNKGDTPKELTPNLNWSYPTIFKYNLRKRFRSLVRSH